MASPVISFKALHRLSLGLMGAIASTLVLTAGSALAQAVAQYGDTGSTVSAIQQELGITVDGVYGPETEDAVAAFQARNGLTVDGVAGPETLRAMGLDYLGYYGGPTSDSTSTSYSYNSPFIASGSRGAVVRTPSGSGINIRNAPNGQPIGGLDDGTWVPLTGRQQTAGGYTWAELDTGGSGWVATEFLVAGGIGGPSDPVVNSRQGRYVVAIPGDSRSDLRTAQIYAPGAFIDRVNQGTFINAGAYNDRSAADRLVDTLRDQGLDARLSVRRLR